MNCSSAEKAYNNDIITWNDYLEMINMEPVEGGDVLKSERNGKEETNEGGNQETPGIETETDV